MLIDLDRCVGCYACQVTCKSVYNLPFGISRCRVDTHISGSDTDIKKLFIPRLCNHCENAPCIEACGESALIKTLEGIVILNREKCINCQACYDKCPYNAIEVEKHTGAVEKCDFCYERIGERKQKPVCVQSCMGKALQFGDMNDTKSLIYNELLQSEMKVLNPEFRTSPSVFYRSKRDLKGIPLVPYKEADTKASPRQHINAPSQDKAVSRRTFFTSDAMCPSECGITVEVENGTAKSILGNPHSLINNGTLCAKGASGLQLTYSPHRIKTPLRRTGERGSEQWEEITWDEAANHIAGNLVQYKKEFGPESVFIDCGDVTDREAYYRLFHSYGTPNIYNHGSICDPNRKWGHTIMTGDERPLPDVQRPMLIRNDDGELVHETRHTAKLIINIGANPFVATRFNYMSAGIPAAKEENQCTYIVVDPALTNSAAHADIWLPIKPGNDAALLAAMLFYIIRHDSPSDSSKKYIDHRFIKDFTLGWDDFKSAFLLCTKEKDPSNDLDFFSLEWAENKTGISVEDIEKVSHMFGITKPASIEVGMHGTAHHTNGDVTSIIMTALCMITGNIDVPGGLVFIDTQKAVKGSSVVGKEFLDKKTVRAINDREVSGMLSELHKDSYGDFPAAWKGVLTDLPKKIRDGVVLKYGPFKGHSYPVKAFITRAGNPVITAGNTPDWINAFTKKDSDGSYLLDLIVFIDTHITETGKYADIVLPEAGFLERMGLSDVYTMSPEIAIRDKVIQPLHDSKTPFEMMCVIADALEKQGDPDVSSDDFINKYGSEEDFINALLTDSPGYYNVGTPLPYPELPEGCLIVGTPDNPSAIWGTKKIKEGEKLTVDWLRKHNGVAVWPASYYRYKRSDGSPSGVYPKTLSHRFEFRFSYLKEINEKFGTDLPTTFYWSESRWNPSNLLFSEFKKEYPFQLISGRGHYAMTMTGVCPYLAETETECMKPLNSDFTYSIPESINSPGCFPGAKEMTFQKGSVSIPVVAMNKNDASQLGIKTGDTLLMSTPLKQKLKGKAYVTDEIMPGVIKTAFGPGGQNASGTGFIGKTAEYTPNINELTDPENISLFTGMPGFGDIMVNIVKVD